MWIKMNSLLSYALINRILVLVANAELMLDMWDSRGSLLRVGCNTVPKNAVFKRLDVVYDRNAVGDCYCNLTLHPWESNSLKVDGKDILRIYDPEIPRKKENKVSLLLEFSMNNTGAFACIALEDGRNANSSKIPDFLRLQGYFETVECSSDPLWSFADGRCNSQGPEPTSTVVPSSTKLSAPSITRSKEETTKVTTKQKGITTIIVGATQLPSTTVTSNTMESEKEKMKGGPSSLIIGLLVGLGVLLIVVIIIAVYLCRRRKMKSPQENKEGPYIPSQDMDMSINESQRPLTMNTMVNNNDAVEYADLAQESLVPKAPPRRQDNVDEETSKGLVYADLSFHKESGGNGPTEEELSEMYAKPMKRK